MIDTGRDGISVISALRDQKVDIGRLALSGSNAVPVTVGNAGRDGEVPVAFADVMSKPAMASGPAPPHGPTRNGRSRS